MDMVMTQRARIAFEMAAPEVQDMLRSELARLGQTVKAGAIEATPTLRPSQSRADVYVVRIHDYRIYLERRENDEPPGLRSISVRQR